MQCVTVRAECPLCDHEDEGIPEHGFHGTFIVDEPYIDYVNGGGDPGGVEFFGFDLQCEYADRKKVNHETLTAEQELEVKNVLWVAYIAGDSVVD